MFDLLWDQTRPAFKQDRPWQRARTLALGVLVALGRRTISGMLSASGQQFADWSAAYRVFAHERFDTGALLAPARRAVLGRLGDGQPLVAMLDDTLLRKRGRKIAGAGWRRDPLGPPFCNNFIWAQRFVQVAAALPEGPGPSRARAIPIDMLHCPSPRKPCRNAPEAQWEQYRRDAQASRISLRGAERVAALRSAMDADGHGDRDLVVSADGSFTNAAMMRTLPERTAFIGRIRKDAKLFALPEQSTGRGRRRLYGHVLPTPEQLRQDGSIPWRQVKAFLAGQCIDIECKDVGPLRWRAARGRNLRLVIVRPLAYRPAIGRHLLYRDPVYLVCTDPQFALDRLIQAYLWRWEIEVGFRDQKTLLGSGQAQVRTSAGVERVPALIAAAYSFMHLALTKSSSDGNGIAHLPRPRWHRPRPDQRCTTQQAINTLRAQLWGRALGVRNYGDFIKRQQVLAKCQKLMHDPASALFYADG
ncbi:MAG TPA: transposase [Bacillota bacterium]|nr:transposase [Bacillota bacterium]